MGCSCKQAPHYLTPVGGLPSVGGPRDFIDFYGTVQGVFDGARGAVETAVDSVGTAACEALAANGIGGQPVAQVWNGQVVQTLVFWGGYMPPPIMPFTAILTFAGDALATCKVSEPMKRAMCRQLAVFQLLRSLFDNDFVVSLVEQSVGDAVAAVVEAIGTFAHAGETLTQPFCTGELPSPEELLSFVTELAFATKKIEDNGGPRVFAFVSPVIAAALGEAAVEAIQNGEDPDEVVRVALDESGYTTVSPLTQGTAVVTTITGTGPSLGAYFPPPSSPEVLEPEDRLPPPPPPSGGGGGGVFAAVLLAALSG